MGILVVNSDFGKIWGITEREYYSRQYLTYELLEDQLFRIDWSVGVIDPDERNTDIMRQISFSLDDGKTWVDVAIDDEEGYESEMLPKGQKILFKGNGGTYYFDNDEYIQIVPDATFKVYGNLMSLVYGDSFEGKGFDEEKSQIFNFLFYNLDMLMDATNLILPNNVIEGCYVRMFDGCTALTTAPELPATTLAQYCYDNMFANCSELNTVMCYAQENITTDNLNGWLDGVAAEGTFYQAKGALYTKGTSGVPIGWARKNIEE